MLMSARGQPFADVSMVIADVSVDSVNIDQVNGSTGQWTHLSAARQRLTCRSLVSAGQKGKRKREGLAWVLGSKKMGRLSSAHTARFSLGDRLIGLSSVWWTGLVRPESQPARIGLKEEAWRAEGKIGHDPVGSFPYSSLSHSAAYRLGPPISGSPLY